MKTEQKILTYDQIATFYHQDFVERQISDFMALLGPSATPAIGAIIDIGGGCGFFAKALQDRLGVKVKVLDSDRQSLNACEQKGVQTICGDALEPTINGDEEIVCLNLILHHLVGESEHATYKMQGHALAVWHSTATAVFVNEYIYESFLFRNWSGWCIYQITSNVFISAICKWIAKYCPSLKANTFGVGVRFRSHEEWRRMFVSLGFDVVDSIKGVKEQISLPRRLLLIKSVHRDSFLLKPIQVNSSRIGT